MLMSIAGASHAQFTKVSPPNAEVRPSTFDYRATATGYSFTWVNDGRNGRAAINFGEGVSLASLVKNLPTEVGVMRLVPMVTLDAGEEGADPRPTMALLTRDYRVNKYMNLQSGVVLNGLQANDSWRRVNGVSPVFRVSFFLK